MTHPDRVLAGMAAFVAVVAVLAAILFEALREAFLANMVFNGMIVGVLLVGIAINIRHVMRLKPEREWLENYRDGLYEPPRRPARLLAPIMKILTGSRREQVRLSALAMRSLLDGIRLRLDESRDLSHYLVGLLIFLGLLGTFWGLLQTVSSAGEVIAGLSAGDDASGVFNEIKEDLQEPLAGMGTAFSSSLFGLAGALVLGFMDLQSGHAQNRFYNDLEEWLAESAHLPTGVAGAEGEQPIPAYVQALLEQTADSLDNLQRLLGRSEEEKRHTHASLQDLTDKLSTLSDQLRSEQKAILTLTRTQAELQPVIARLSTAMAEGLEDDALRGHVRNLDVMLSRLVEEVGSARSELTEQFRNEMRLLARTIAGRGGV